LDGFLPLSLLPWFDEAEEEVEASSTCLALRSLLEAEVEDLELEPLVLAEEAAPELEADAELEEAAELEAEAELLALLDPEEEAEDDPEDDEPLLAEEILESMEIPDGTGLGEGMEIWSSREAPLGKGLNYLLYFSSLSFLLASSVSA
jgi:hypothetical protein